MFTIKKPNILFYFSDQQRFDTLGCNGQPLNITPTLDRLARGGANFKRAYTIQPVCGPARAALQSGLYPTQAGCFRNGISLPEDIRTLARRLVDRGYDAAYVGKWHLASDDRIPEKNYEIRPVPPEKRGGYDGYWVASDVLEMTSHGYGGHLFDADGARREFAGYRCDAVTDFALAYLDRREAGNEQPFFLFLSHIEPHHQNDHGHFEGPKGSRERFAGYAPPAELEPGTGDWEAELPDYLGCCRSLDDNLARIIEKLRERGIYEDTVIIYTSDHGCHFRTRTGDAATDGYDDYKRSCYENTIHIPLVISGPGFSGWGGETRTVDLLDVVHTIAVIAGADTAGMQGRDLTALARGEEWLDESYIQISESYVGRCLRTERYTYCVWAPDRDPNNDPFAAEYRERFLFDNDSDPHQRNNLAGAPEYAGVRRALAERLKARAALAGEPALTIIPL